MKLIRDGYLSIADVFEHYAPYGIVTFIDSENSHDQIIKVIQRVNRLYNAVYYQDQDSAVQFLKDHVGGYVIASRRQMHTELKETYGAESDTDSEGYSSSEDNTPMIEF
ncbi:MAG: hypothetical protein HWD59_14190 [Coxiellaceae bacterium]|nr:MAG: hypothetical protein HWD59_14190 [Coxiellaceae bacterium]